MWVRLQLPDTAGTCHSLSWREATPGLPPLLLGGHDAGGSIWGYNSPTMSWQVCVLLHVRVCLSLCVVVHVGRRLVRLMCFTTRF